MTSRFLLSIISLFQFYSVCYSQEFYFEDTTEVITIKILSRNNECIRAKVIFKIKNQNVKIVENYFGYLKSGDYEIEEFEDGLSYPLLEYNNPKLGVISIEKDMVRFCKINFAIKSKKKKYILNRLLKNKNRLPSSA